MEMEPGGGVTPGVTVGDGHSVGLGVIVAVAVEVGVGEDVGVESGGYERNTNGRYNLLPEWGDGVGVFVATPVGVGLSDGVSVGVSVSVGVEVTVGVFVDGSLKLMVQACDTESISVPSRRTNLT